MSTVKMTRGKFDGINACADARGVIAAAAMDQRGSLQKAIATGRGEGGKADDLVGLGAGDRCADARELVIPDPAAGASTLRTRRWPPRTAPP